MKPTRLILLTGALLAGCATAPKSGFESVRQITQDRTGGARITWRSGVTADAQVAREVDDMLAQPLTPDQAVQIALLSHPKLQAEYEHLGVAQADLVEAGLLRNPVFSAMVRWPKGGGGPNVELGVAADFLDVLFVGARKRIATAEFERERLNVADAVVSHAAEVRSAFYQVQGARQMLELRRTVLAAEEAAAETAQRMRAAGNISQLDADREQAMLEQSRVQLIDAEADVRQKIERLAAAMGMPGRDDRLQIPDRLPAPSGGDESLDDLTHRAQDQRLDLAAAARETLALERTLGLTRSTALGSGAEVGVSTERDPDGGRVTGPEISVPLPIFDLGHARVAAAQHRLAESRRRREALDQQARSEVRLAYADMTAARKRFEHLRDNVLPLRQRIVQQSQLHYNAMLLGVFELLEAKQNEIDAGREYVAALTDYWTARAELERAVGGRLSTTPNTQPSTVPAMTSPAADHSHHQ
jgi:cobalt-zinc-cadmium efflux system outer membrane protein